jgi:hypothetical protein
MKKADEQRVAKLERQASCRHAKLKVRAEWVPDQPFTHIHGVNRAHWEGMVICADCGASWPACGVEVKMAQKEE